MSDLSRRQFLGGSILALLAPGAALESLGTKRLTRFGLVTDVHFARTPARGTRHYEDSLAKLTEATAHFRSLKTDCVIELGDLIDSAPGVDARGEIKFLETINKVLTTGAPKAGYVIGNHCVTTVTKPDFLSAVGQKRGNISFDVGDWNVIILDACHKVDGTSYEPGKFTVPDTTIPEGQIQWLESRLRSTKKHTLVFCHQRLDWTTPERPGTGVISAPQVRQVLEDSGRVRAVFMGHTHQNDLTQINGIPYVTLRAMVEGKGAENSGYSDLLAYSDGSLLLKGFREQLSRVVR